MKKYLKSMFVAGLLLANLSLFADTPPPFSLIHNLPQTPYFVLDGYIYYSLISSQNAAVIIDVDSQDGSVARYIAQQVATLPSVKQIYSISAWQNSDHSQKHLFQRFLSNVSQENTADLITPIRMSSLEAAGALNIVADFISLVGANDRDAIYNEIIAWFPHLSATGVICGNNWDENEVQEGVTEAAAALNVSVNVDANVWYIENVSQ